MTAAEASSLEALAGFDDAIRLRHYDDEGKCSDWAAPPLETYRPLLERLIRT